MTPRIGTFHVATSAPAAANMATMDAVESMGSVGERSSEGGCTEGG
jgi:hypothetical protein